MPAWQVTSIPRRAPGAGSAGAEDGDLLAPQRVAALAAAFHAGGPVAFGWAREAAGGPVRVLAAGAALGPSADGGQALLTLPAGGRGIPVPGVADCLARLPHWAAAGGVADALLAGELPGAAGRDVAPGLEDGLLAAWHGPFAWLVLALPVARACLEDLAAAAERALAAARQYEHPASRLRARRLEGRLAELRRSPATGLWQVHLLAGAVAPSAAAQVAGLVCASADLRGLPYALVPGVAAGTLAGLLESRPAPAPALPGSPALPGALPAAPFPGAGPDGGDRDDAAPRFPVTASSALLAALARPPAREVPGVRLALRPEFDVTPEAPPAAGPGVPAGVVLDRNRMPAGPLAVPLASLNRHAFVTGATGSGKSQTIRGLLEAATGAGIPWLVIEPAKAEYAAMAARLPGARVIRIRPGDPGDPPAGLNPLEPPAGPGGTRFPLQAHADLVRALFLAAFGAEEPFPQVLAAALTRCYEDAGWDLALGEPAAGPSARPAWPTLADLEAAAAAVIGEIGYGREVTDNVRGFVRVRLASLRLGTAGRLYEGGHPLDLAALLDANVVLEIEDCGDDQDRAFLTGAVVIALAGHLRLRHRARPAPAGGLAHLTVIEEAHRLLRAPARDAGPAARAVEMLAGLLAEVRAYGEGLVIADQIPAKLIPDVIKNTAVKIVHRLPAQDDRDAVGATMNLTPAQSACLVTLPPGEAAVFTDGMDYPILARMPDGTAREDAPAATATPAAITGRRSPGCGPDCQQDPCTLRQMRAAQRAATTDPRITIWAEIAVLAHLTGWAMPMPGPALTTALARLGTRLRDCALSHAADAAVAARAPAITARLSPPGLAAHVTAAMRQAAATGQRLCERRESRYLAPAWQWAIILDSLRTLLRTDPAAARHPDTAAWEAACARPIPGATSAAQADTVRAWHDQAQRDHRAVHVTAWGTRTPPAIEQALAAPAASSDWDTRLAAALADYQDCRWPLDYLRPAPQAP
jgi:uncharacterized protein